MNRRDRQNRFTADAAKTASVWALSAAIGLVVAVPAGAAPARIAQLAAFDGAAVSGGRIVYGDARTGDWDIFVTTAGGEAERITGEGDQMSPDISGDVVVYVDYARGDADIRGYDLSARREFDICNAPGSQVRPRISGDWVVWLELGAGAVGKVQALNIASGEQVVIAAGKASGATIGGSLVVYEDYSGTGADIRAYDLESGTAQVIADAESSEVLPSTDGDWVFWAQPGEDGSFDVRGRRLSDGEVWNTTEKGEQTSPVVDGGRVYLIDRSGDRGMRIVGRALPGSDVGDTTVAHEGDAVLFDAADGDFVLVSGEGDGWSVSGAIERSTGARVSAWVRSVWHRIAPPRHVAWKSDGPTRIVGRGVQRTGVVRAPLDVDARVVSGTQVRITWREPFASASVANYDVYRYVSPITEANLDSATKIASELATTTYIDTITPSLDTTIEASSRFYAVVARDAESEMGPLSLSASPNPHGADVYGTGSIGCLQCHRLHGSTVATSGALGAASASACYECHGQTPDSAEFAAGALNDVQAGFREDSAVATAGPALPDGGSIHRNATMVQLQNECSACHDPHKRAYVVDDKGAYLPSASYSKGLRAQLTTGAVGTYAVWPDSDPAGNEICLVCHGTSATPMTIAGGATAYSRSGGDHAASDGRTYTESAHGPSTVTTNSTAPGTQCEVCHNRHGSATARLIDYRNSGTADPNANKQANLCYRCHRAAAASAWNGRVVPVEMSRASAHPSVATTSAGVASTTCVSCHNTHFVQKGGAGSWATARVSSPVDTGAAPGDSTSFCLGCHSGGAADGSISIARNWSSSTLVPYPVFLRPTGTWRFFTSWNKGVDAGGALGFSGSGHFNASVAEGRALCETCHDPHGSDFDNLTAWYSGGQDWSSGTPNAALRSGSTDGNASNRDTAFGSAVSFEEALCLQCHGSSSAGTSVTIAGPSGAGITVLAKKAPGAQDVLSGMDATFAHGIQSYGGRHTNTENAATLAGDQAERHVECADCHDPHSARNNGTAGQAFHVAGSSIAGNALRGAVGLIPAWTSAKYDGTNGSVRAADGTRKRFDGTATGSMGDYEAYLCFKCHSGDANGSAYTVTTDSGTYTATNVAAEFNPVNESGHNVLGSQTTWPKTGIATGILINNWNFPTTSVFRNGWSVNSKVTCSDCHSADTSGARGPHGGSRAYLVPEVDGAYTRYAAATLDADNAFGMSAGTVCAKCHDLRNGGWGNSVHERHAGMAGDNQCVDCHTRIPHGWRRPRLLGYTTDAAPYRSNHLTGFTRTVAGVDRNYPEDWVDANNCGQSGCHRHNATPQGIAYP